MRWTSCSDAGIRVWRLRRAWTSSRMTAACSEGSPGSRSSQDPTWVANPPTSARYIFTSPHLITTTTGKGKSTYLHPKEGVTVMHLFLLMPSRCCTCGQFMYLKLVMSNGQGSMLLLFNLAHLRQQQKVSLLPSKLPCLPSKPECRFGCTIQLLRS